jgi:hypothetical protein
VASQSSSTAPVASQPANPVPILRETGAQIPAGEVYGSRDINGDLYANGNFYGPNCTAADNCSEQVTVTTVVPGTLAQIMAENADATPSDSNAVIMGDNFYVTLTPVASLSNSNAYTWFVSAATVAARVRGRVLTPTS